MHGCNLTGDPLSKIFLFSLGNRFRVYAFGHAVCRDRWILRSELIRLGAEATGSLRNFLRFTLNEVVATIHPPARAILSIFVDTLGPPVFTGYNTSSVTDSGMLYFHPSGIPLSKGGCLSNQSRAASYRIRSHVRKPVYTDRPPLNRSVFHLGKE